MLLGKDSVRYKCVVLTTYGQRNRTGRTFILQTPDMRNLLLALLLLPSVTFAQSAAYFSADAGPNFGKSLSATGYSVSLGANARLSDKLYAGIASGILRVQPFVDNLAIPLLGRITFFTSGDEVKLSPFGLFEVGKLLYKQENFGGSGAQKLEGKLSYFAGVGVKLSGSKKTHPFFALGYAGHHFDNNYYATQSSPQSSRPYHFRRMAIRIGLMLPH